MGGPDESFADDRVAFIVDLEPPVVHQPRPRPLDDPTSRENLEAMVVDPLHDFGRDVVGSACCDGSLLESSVAPGFRQTARTVACLVHNGDPAGVIRHAGCHHGHRYEDPKDAPTPKVFLPESFLPASYPLVERVTVDAPRTLRASITPPEGSASRPSCSRTLLAC